MNIEKLKDKMGDLSRTMRCGNFSHTTTATMSEAPGIGYAIKVESQTVALGISSGVSVRTGFIAYDDVSEHALGSLIDEMGVFRIPESIDIRMASSLLNSIVYSFSSGFGLTPTNVKTCIEQLERFMHESSINPIAGGLYYHLLDNEVSRDELVVAARDLSSEMVRSFSGMYANGDHVDFALSVACLHAALLMLRIYDS